MSTALAAVRTRTIEKAATLLEAELHAYQMALAMPEATIDDHRKAVETLGKLSGAMKDESTNTMQTVHWNISGGVVSVAVQAAEPTHAPTLEMVEDVTPKKRKKKKDAPEAAAPAPVSSFEVIESLLL